jgi:EAL and modified HD-GYP domain-containing signal transduction protein
MRYKLLRLANSVMHGGRHIIKRTNIALARIGLNELRTWMLFVVMHGMHMNKPNELIRQSMIRAWAAEEICKRKKFSTDSSGFSLLGLFSLLDAIMDAPFSAILSSVNIPENIKTALVNPDDNNGMHCVVVRFIKAYENAAWEEAEAEGKHIDLSLEQYGEIYLNAIKWCDSIYNRIQIKD